MKFTVVTILPELIGPALAAGVVGRAREAGVIAVDTITPRDFTHDKHRTVDDSPYGGGPGMVMKPEPLLAAIAAAGPGHRVLLSPAGAPLTQARVRALAAHAHLVLVCGRYEGIDDRVVGAVIDDAGAPRVGSAAEGRRGTIDDAGAPRVGSAAEGRRGTIDDAGAPRVGSAAEGRRGTIDDAGAPRVGSAAEGRRGTIDDAGAPRVGSAAEGRRGTIDEEISLGDYVLSGGELGALVIIDAVARLVPGVLGEATSADDESFASGLLEYPQYTRPQALGAAEVPAILQSGNHAAIAAWRRVEAMRRTAARRPDLWHAFRPTAGDRKLLAKAGTAPLAERTHIALVHHPVMDRTGAVVTTALTNFDIHDLARAAMTYGCAGYHIVTPVTSQREKASHIATMWMEDQHGAHRAAALQLVRTAAAIEDVIATLTADTGHAPVVVATSAKDGAFPAAARRTPRELAAEQALSPAPVLVLFGTGWGLAEALIPSVSRVLAPIDAGTGWNHLSVRSAVAITLDRLLGPAP